MGRDINIVILIHEGHHRVGLMTLLCTNTSYSVTYR